MRRELLLEERPAAAYELKNVIQYFKLQSREAACVFVYSCNHIPLRLRPTTRSPAPEANNGLAKAKFCPEMAEAKNAPAFGVWHTDWFCVYCLF